MVRPADREALEQAVVRGSELLKQSRLDQAQRAFRAALEIDPDNARVLALLGLAHFRAGELADARVIYEQLVERAPTDASHRLNLGLVHLKLNDADRAIAALEASRALDPSQGRAVSYLGLAYARGGRYGEAYRSFLIAGQNDLAIEIETNLTSVERDRIHGQLGRTPQGPAVAASRAPAPPSVSRTPTPMGIPRTPTPALVARTPTPSDVSYTAPPATATRTPTPTGVPRTRPPSPPPTKRISREFHVPAPAAPPESPIESPTESPLGSPLGQVAREPSSAPADAPARSDAVPSPATDHGPAARQPARITDSTQFVMPYGEAAVPQQLLDGPSMISRAVAVASATTPVLAGLRTRAGGIAPRPLSELATDDLVRPDDGDDAFEIAANGALIIRVTERVLTRLDGVHVSGGDLGYEPAMRRSRGHNTDEAFDYRGSPLHAVGGRGYLIAVPGTHVFSAVMLDDDILYLREDLVFAFQASLRWENGNVPGLRGKLPVVQFRGDGALVMRLERPLVRIKLSAHGMVFVDADRLAGWIGRVIPRAVVPPAGGPLGAMCVECTGEGIVLVEPRATAEAASAVASLPSEPARPATPAVPAALATPADRPDAPATLAGSPTQTPDDASADALIDALGRHDTL